MTTKPKPVTLFGRRMREGTKDYGPDSYMLGGQYVLYSMGGWFGHSPEFGNTGDLSTPHAAARALERKIESQWKRLGKFDGEGQMRRLFTVVHHLVSHPLLLTGAAWATRFHDWTARRMS